MSNSLKQQLCTTLHIFESTNPIIYLGNALPISRKKEIRISRSFEQIKDSFG